MKKILTTIFAIISLTSFGQNDIAMNDNNTQNGFMFISPETNHKIDLKLPTNKKVDEGKSAYVALLVAGLAFTVAAIAEGSSQYGTWVTTTPQNSYNNQYGAGPQSSYTTFKTPGFWQQTPRQLMLVAGIGMSITGGILTIKSK